MVVPSVLNSSLCVGVVVVQLFTDMLLNMVYGFFPSLTLSLCLSLSVSIAPLYISISPLSHLSRPGPRVRRGGPLTVLSKDESRLRNT